MFGESKFFSVILVRPQDSLNVGSVARAMKNLGFSKLVLVNPEEFDVARAAITACWASDLLDSIVIAESLEEALADHQDVIGFSGRIGKSEGGYILLPNMMDTLSSELRTALVFGPEDNGLDTEEASLCRILVRIPASVECPSYNLSQAVLLVLAEISRGSAASNTPGEISGSSMPDWNDYAQLSRIVQSVAEKSGFFRDGTPRPVPHLVKSLLRRLRVDRREMSIVIGLFSRIERHINYLGRSYRGKG